MAGEWTQLVSLKGPQGDQGPIGSQGTQGVQGVPGVDGAGIAIAGSVATYGDLPTGLTSADAGDGYIVTNPDGKLYIWDGSAFPAEGAGTAFRGPQGLQGPQGVEGPAGSQGIQGIQGEIGNTGSAGARGATWYTGTGVPTTIVGSMANDLYLRTDTGTVYTLS